MWWFYWFMMLKFWWTAILRGVSRYWKNSGIYAQDQEKQDGTLTYFEIVEVNHERIQRSANVIDCFVMVFWLFSVFCFLDLTYHEMLMMFCDVVSNIFVFIASYRYWSIASSWWVGDSLKVSCIGVANILQDVDAVSRYFILSSLQLGKIFGYYRMCFTSQVKNI